MKKIKLLTAGVMALSAVTAVSAAAYAADVVDFEDGKYSFVSMKTDDGGDPSTLSVVDFGGSKQLKVDVTDCANVPKVYFDLNSMLDPDNFDKVKTIEMDVTFESKDGVTAPGWAGGAIGTQGGEAKTPAWAQTAWECGEYDKAVSDPVTIQRKFLLYSERLVNGTEGTHMILMRWGAEVDYNMYVDNIKFLDADGKAIPLELKESAAPVQTEAAPEETAAEPEPEDIPEETEAPAETEAPETEAAPEETEPESDNETTSSTTGNFSAFAAASAVVLSGYAVAMTRRKKK
ncbi:MAG: hypothetical protein ACI4J0_02500 [Huintestinicola sp.]|uniref:hypothetical protein n=1 Tax=Huintestinicola sp. TaxID=2981661 RepID=UPI003F02BB2A